MADYYTTAALSTAPLKAVPADVLAVLRALSGAGGEGEELDEFLATLSSGTYHRDLLQLAGIVGKDGKWDEDVLSSASEMTVSYYEEDDDLYLDWEESLSDGAGAVLQWLLLCLPEVKYLQVDAANTCSKPRSDGFGGFCLVVTRDDVRWFHAYTAAERYVRVVEGTVVDPIKVFEEVFQKPRPRDGDRLAYWFDLMAGFVRAQGLDQELKKYLTEQPR